VASPPASIECSTKAQNVDLTYGKYSQSRLLG